MRQKAILCLISLLFVIVFVILSQESASAKPDGWSNDIPLTIDDNEESRDSSIAINGSVIHVVWEDQRHYVSNAPEIYYKNSTNGGKTWNPERRLTNIESLKLGTKIAANGSNIHVMWIDDRDAIPGNKIYYMNSTDGGATWSTERRISSDISDGADVDIAVNGSNIHVAYSDDSEDGGGDEQLFYVNSTDSGLTWSNPRRLIYTLRYTFDLAIDVYNDNVHIVWCDGYDKVGNLQFGDVFYINSTDNGITWSEEQNLTPLNNNPLQSGEPYISVYKDNVHVIFGDDRTGTMQIYYRKSVDNGITWSDNILLTNNSESKGKPEIMVYEYNVSIIWVDERDGNYEIYYKNSSNNGDNWNDNIRLTYDDGYSSSPDLEVNKNKIDIVWMDRRDTYFEIYYKQYPVPSSPSNLTIDIWGTNLTLNWTAPQNSPSPVDHYLIYRVTDPDSFTFSDSEIIYNSSGTGNDLLTTWNDTIAFLDESNNYYYVVRAIDAEGWNDTNTKIVGKFVIPMKSGWNLISLPLAQRYTSISKVLQTIDGNYNVIWIYDAKEDRWRSSATDLTDINRTMGLWIHMKNSCNLSIIGAVPEFTDITLYEGWDLVGYPSFVNRNPNDALNGISWQAVQHYDAFDANDPWKHNSTKKPDNLNDLKEMKPGRGYWVYVTINDTWVRTRVAEDNKMVIWRVGESEKKVVYDQSIYEPTIESPTKIGGEDYQIDNVEDDEPIIEQQENNLAIFLIPLIILIALVFTEVWFLHYIRKIHL